jgi:hypothetical protein
MNHTGLRAVLAAAALTGLLSPPLARADGDCVARPATAAEQKVYADSYALFLKVAPAAPAGWTFSDSPKTGAMPTLCEGSEGQPFRRGFSRQFTLDQGRQERQDQAVAGYTDMMKKSQEMQAKNQAAIAALDEKINANMERVQKAVAAQRFGDIETINIETEKLMQQKSALMGFGEMEATSERIAADAERDSAASFQLSFEAPPAGPREGEPYTTSAGRARVAAYDEKGVAYHDVTIDFDSRLAEHPVVRVRGDPQRVRELVDAADLKSVTAAR